MISDSMHSGYELLDSGAFQKLERFGQVTLSRPCAQAVWKQTLAPQDWQRAKAAELPLGRFGEPEEVADTVAFLCSPQSALFVGQTLGPNSGDVML